MIGAVMFFLLIGLMFIGVPIAFSMGLSAIIMLLINATATPVAITTRAVNSLDSFTTMAIPFFMMASSILSGSNVGVKIFRFAGTLVRHLREQDPRRLGQLAIIGYGNMLLAQRSDPSITSISDDYEHFGKAALSIYQLVAKEPTMSAVRILLHSRLHVRKTTGFVPFDPGSAEMEREIPPAAENPFFADREVQDLARVETLLQQMDEVDLELLRRLMEGRTNAEIAQLCYLSETALKYRLRKMEKVCGVCGREALAAFLEGFFEKE